MKRHPAQSWHEHYRKNRDRLDPIIADIIQHNPVPADGHTLYPFSRKSTKRNRFRPDVHSEDEREADHERDEDQEHDEDQDQYEVEKLVTPKRQRKPDQGSREPMQESPLSRSISQEEGRHNFRDELGSPLSFFQNDAENPDELMVEQPQEEIDPDDDFDPSAPPGWE